MNLETRSRMSRLKLRDRDTIEKENIRKRIKQLGGEDQNAKDLIYNCHKDSDIYICESERFNRDYEKDYRRQRKEMLEKREIKRNFKTQQQLERRQKLWREAHEKDLLFEKKVQIKKKRVHDNPLVNNLGFDLLNLQYKQTQQGRSADWLIGREIFGNGDSNEANATRVESQFTATKK